MRGSEARSSLQSRRGFNATEFRQHQVPRRSGSGSSMNHSSGSYGRIRGTPWLPAIPDEMEAERVTGQPMIRVSDIMPT